MISKPKAMVLVMNFKKIYIFEEDNCDNFIARQPNYKLAYSKGMPNDLPTLIIKTSRQLFKTSRPLFKEKSPTAKLCIRNE